MSESTHAITLHLDESQAAALALAADRLNASETQYAEEVLIDALTADSLSGQAMTEILKSIPGAVESLKRGNEDIAAGRTVPIDQIK